MDVALAQAGGGDPDELRLRPQLFDAVAAGVTHPAAEAADELEDVHREGALVGHASLDALGDELHVFGLVLEVPVAGASLHGAHRPHPAVRLVGAALEENHLARCLLRPGEERPDHHGVRARRERLDDVAGVLDPAVGDAGNPVP